MGKWVAGEISIKDSNESSKPNPKNKERKKRKLERKKEC